MIVLIGKPARIALILQYVKLMIKNVQLKRRIFPVNIFFASKIRIIALTGIKKKKIALLIRFAIKANVFLNHALLKLAKREAFAVPMILTLKVVDLTQKVALSGFPNKLVLVGKNAVTNSNVAQIAFPKRKFVIIKTITVMVRLTKALVV